MSKQYVVEETTNFLLLNKKAGIPCVPDQSGDKSLLDIMSQKKNIVLYPIHRIDRPVSGLVIFGKTKAFTTELSKLFQKGEIQKTYLAITEQQLQENERTLAAHLTHNKKRRRAEIMEDLDPNAKLHYKLKASSDRYFLYQIEIEGGKFHQIRAMLAHQGCHIKGDVKYGARRANKDRSICLHAHTMQFRNHKTHETEIYRAQLPEDNLWNYFRDQLFEEE